jgi:hypothetical protein
MLVIAFLFVLIYLYMENILINQKGYNSKIFKFAYTLFKTHWKALVGMAIILLVFNILPEFLGESFVINVAVSIISGYITVGFMKTMLMLVDGKEVNVKDIFTSITSREFLITVGVYVLGGLLTLIGFLLLIVPGIIISLGLSQAIYIVLDKKLGVIKSLKLSWEITKGHKMEIFSVGIHAAVVLLVGLLVVGVGLLVAMPIAYIMYAKVYRDLSLLGHEDGEKEAMVDAEDIEVVREDTEQE